MRIKSKTTLCFVFNAIAFSFLVATLLFWVNVATAASTTTAVSATTSAAQVVSTTTTTGAVGASFLFLGNQNITPVVFVEDNAPAGIAVDIVKALEPYLSKPVEIRAMDWPTAQALVADGKADALIQINPTEERKNIYDFSNQLLESQFSVFTRTDRVDVSGISSLHGLRVGVEKGGLPEQTLAAHPEIQLIIISDFIDGFNRVSDGTLDAVVVDYRVGSYILAKNNIQDIRATAEAVAFSYSAIAVKKGNTKLLGEINVALQKIKANGMYQAILNKWKPTEVVFQTQDQITHEIYIAVIVVLSILFILIISWSIVTNRELAKRKKAETYSEKLISGANAMIIGLDINGNVTIFNEAAEEVSGYKKAEVMGRNWFELVVPRERFPEVWKAFAEFQKQGKSIVGEFQNPILTKRGEERIIEWRNSDLLDSGRVVGTISYGIDITERKRAEEELKQLSQRNEKILNSAGEGIYGTDVNGNIVFINTSAAKLLGYDAREMLGKNSHQLFHHTKPDGSPYPFGECPLHKSLTTGEVVRGQNEVFWTHDGKPIDIEHVNAPLVDGGKVVGGVVVFGDITERKQAEKAVHESQEKFFVAFNSSPDLMAITRVSDGKILEINGGYSQMLGFSREESIGKTTAELSIWAKNSDRAKFVAALKKDGQVLDFETALRRKDGTTVTVIDSARTFDLQGEACILSTAHDITDRKKMEEKMRENAEELIKAQRLGRIGNWDWDIATDKITWSEEYYRLIGFDPTQPPPNYEDHLKVYTAESAARLDAAVKKNTKTGEPYELDLEFANPKTSTRWITARSETKRDANGKITGLRGTAQDITERKMNEERLKELDKLKDDFLMVTTHELKSPLLPIKAQSQMLLAGDYGKIS